MKKFIASVVTLVLVLSLSLVALVACNKDEDAKASNSEVLGTAVAVAAQYAGASASTAAESEEGFNAGVNISIGDGEASLTAGASVKGLGAIIAPVLENTINKVDLFLGENGISVAKVDSDDQNYSEKYAVTITYIDEETAETKTEEYALYVNLSEGAELEGKKDYTFDAKVVLSQYAQFEFSGTATFDTSKDTMVFALGVEAGAGTAGASASVKAWATKNGSIVVELGASASDAESVGANATVSIELGKLSDNSYGAVLTISGNATVASYGVDFTFVANVSANSADNAGEFAINANLNANGTLPVIGTYNATASLSGKALYDQAQDKLQIGISGVANIVKAESENK